MNTYSYKHICKIILNYYPVEGLKQAVLHCCLKNNKTLITMTWTTGSEARLCHETHFWKSWFQFVMRTKRGKRTIKLKMQSEKLFKFINRNIGLLFGFHDTQLLSLMPLLIDHVPIEFHKSNADCSASEGLMQQVRPITTFLICVHSFVFIINWSSKKVDLVVSRLGKETRLNMHHAFSDFFTHNWDKNINTS